jgi:hypothetical protein
MFGRGARLSALIVIAGLAAAPAAVAYKVPGAPGTPGGKPTAAKGGTGTSKTATKKAATAIAGYTGSELASKGSFTVKVHFPKAGKMSCVASSGSTKLGSGSASDSKAGNKELTVTFSTAGKDFLNAHNGQAIPVSVSCTFKPTKGKTSTSTSKVVLDA